MVNIAQLGKEQKNPVYLSNCGVQTEGGGVNVSLLKDFTTMLDIIW